MTPTQSKDLAAGLVLAEKINQAIASGKGIESVLASTEKAATSSITSKISEVYTSNAQASAASKSIEKLINQNNESFRQDVLSQRDKQNNNSLEKGIQNALVSAQQQYEAVQLRAQIQEQQNRALQEQQSLLPDFAAEVQKSLESYKPGTPKQQSPLPGERAVSDQVSNAIADSDLYNLDPSLYKEEIIRQQSQFYENKRKQEDFNAKQYDDFLRDQKSQTSQRSMNILQSNAKKFEDLGSGFVEDFFGKLSNWSGAIPLQSFWVIIITFPQGLQSRLNSYVNGYDHRPWFGTAGGQGGYDQSVFYNLISSPWQNHVKSDYAYGCFFARSINIPGEKIDTTTVNVVNQGLQFPGLIRGRSTVSEASVSFMETNDSFIDIVLRPWAILGSYLGAVARPRGDSIKGTIDAIFYGKTDPGSNLIVRKSFKLNDVIPIEINSQEYTQAGDALLVRPVRFLYSTYIEGNNTNYGAGQSVSAPAPPVVPVAPTFVMPPLFSDRPPTEPGAVTFANTTLTRRTGLPEPGAPGPGNTTITRQTGWPLPGQIPRRRGTGNTVYREFPVGGGAQ